MLVAEPVVCVVAENDRLVDAASVEQLRLRLLTTLLHTLRRHRPRPLTTFAHIIAALTQLRTLSNDGSRLFILPQHVLPALLQELVV